MKTRNLFAALVLLGGSILAADLPVTTVRTGHAAPVNALSITADGSRLFSIGEDGKLIVWNKDTGGLLQTIHADRMPLVRMAHFPDGERVAVYAGDGRRDHRISVWNWKTGERLFLHEPDDEVLWMEVSPQGSYLIYSIPSLRSIRMLDGNTGRQLPFLRQNTGIVNWFVTATSEERVMTYSPSSGNLAYRNVVTGSTAGTFEAPHNLDKFVLLEQRRYAAVETEEGLLGVVDLLSGDIVTEVRAGTIVSIHREPGNDDILVLSESIIGGKIVRRYRFREGRLQQRFDTRRSIPEETTAILGVGRHLFGTDREGRILQWAPFESEPIVFSESRVQRVRDLLFSRDRLYLLAHDHVISIASDMLSSTESNTERITYVNERVTGIPAGPGSRFLPTGDGEVLLWTPEHRDNRLHSFDAATGEKHPVSVSLPPGVVSISAYGDQVITLTRAGLLQVFNYHTGEETLSYRGAGLQTAIRTGRDLFLGKAYEGGVLDSSLLRIDPNTGQTVPMETEARLVFDLTHDHRRGRLFAIGVIEDRFGDLNTVVEVFDGPNYSRRRTILEIPGEHLDAQVIVDPSRGTAYTTLDDRGGILRWDGLRVTELARNAAHIPRRLSVNDDFVVSVNWDGTVSFTNRLTGNTVLDIVSIADGRIGSWIGLRHDGYFHVSRPSMARENLLSLNRDELNLEDLRFTGQTEAPRQTDPTPTYAPSRRFLDRFDTGRSRTPDVEERTDTFDPESGEPAPSS